MYLTTSVLLSQAGYDRVLCRQWIAACYSVHGRVTPNPMASLRMLNLPGESCLKMA
jgi:hypothetical protein